jgi:predicted metalloprotease with PDZ domain
VLQTPGRKVQSVAQASMDAWVKYYRQNENTPNATVSYYTKGALVALCLDLSLRAARPASDLDALMRALWKHCKGGPMGQGDLLEQLQALGARSYRADLERWVHGTQDLPLKELLQTHGVAVLEEPDQLAQRLGLRVDESQGLKIKAVLSGGPAQTAGLSAGDEWLGIETAAGRGWRLRKLDDLLLHAQPGQALQALVSRDEQLVRLPLRMPKAGTTWRLAVQDAARLERWLTPDPS